MILKNNLRKSLLFVLIIGCAIFGTSSLSLQANDDDSNVIHEHGNVLTSQLWGLEIPVCWVNPTANNAEGRTWTQNAVSGSWEASSGVDFTGWGTCPATNKKDSIRIKIEDVADDGPSTEGLGRLIRLADEGMDLNFTFNNWGESCARSEARRQYCIEAIAVHEFGHALGFAHEHNRDDTPTELCEDHEAQGSNGDVTVGDWDLDSVMNYCNPNWNGDGELSRTDIVTVLSFYASENFRCTDVGAVGISVEECIALVALYHDTGGDDWKDNDGWLQTSTPCSWKGMECHASGGVHRLRVSNNDLEGTIPPEIGELTKLTSLYLASNNLSGEIPAEIGELEDLVALGLQLNELSGSIPTEIGNIPTLKYLLLFDNELEGTIPNSIGGLSNIKQMRIGQNAQLEGQIPASFSNLTNLTELEVHQTALSSQMSQSLVNLPLLTFRYSDTNLCAPDNTQFRNWLNSVGNLRSNDRVCGAD